MTKDEIRKRLLELIGAAQGEQGTASELREYLAASIPTRIGVSGSSAPVETTFPEKEGGPAPAGTEPDSVRLLREQIANLNRNIGDLRQTSQRQLESVDENTRATLENSGKSSVASAVSAVGQVSRVMSGAGSGLTVSPLIGGLIKLFSGKKNEEPSPLQLYVPPPPIRLDGAVSKTGIPGLEEVGYGQDGLPRRNGSGWASGSPPITIQVQTIDSRSFMDHSESIARAVREAMLNMHSLNDVITDL
ncbi:MAG: hypothetical protein JJE04_16495 [Acidobacteriia bacterium]|nr:hypothetical protein [Terriglobia bacterium]